MKDLLAILLCGGLGTRMGALAEAVPKALVPFAGSCRLIDFSLQAAVDLGVEETVFLLQHQQDKIIAHAQTHWAGAAMKLNYCDRDRLPPSAFASEMGTAHALWLNREHIQKAGVRDIVILHCDHVYEQDLQRYYEFHRSSNADLTFSSTEVDLKYVPLFGMLEVDDHGTVTGFVEKPAVPTSTTISAGVWLFKVDALYAHLADLMAAGGPYDISKGLIPRMMNAGCTVKAFPFDGYWEDIGTPELYWEAHVKLLGSADYLSFVRKLPKTLPPERQGSYVHRPEQGIHHSILCPSAERNVGSARNSLVVGLKAQAGKPDVDRSVLLDCDETVFASPILGQLVVKNQKLFATGPASPPDDFRP